MMKSAFDAEGKEKDIVVEFGEEEYKVIYLFDYDKENGKWISTWLPTAASLGSVNEVIRDKTGAKLSIKNKVWGFLNQF